MSDIEFIVEDIPPSNAGRTAGPNPFLDHFPTPEGKSLSLVVPGLGKGEIDTKALARMVRLAREAAAVLDPPMSARTVKSTPDPKTGDIRINIYTGALIIRKRKNTTSETE